MCVRPRKTSFPINSAFTDGVGEESFQFIKAKVIVHIQPARVP